MRLSSFARNFTYTYLVTTIIVYEPSLVDYQLKSERNAKAVLFRKNFSIGEEKKLYRIHAAFSRTREFFFTHDAPPLPQIYLCRVYAATVENREKLLLSYRSTSQLSGCPPRPNNTRILSKIENSLAAARELGRANASAGGTPMEMKPALEMRWQ